MDDGEENLIIRMVDGYPTITKKKPRKESIGVKN